MIITITWIMVAVVALALYLYQVYTTLSRAGLNHLRVVPVFGNLFRPFFNLENITDTLMRLAATFPDDKVVGHYELLNPIYMVQDVETIKQITIKDFDHFVDRRNLSTEDDPMFGRTLLSLRGDEWKEMRSTLSPAFTSSKIRLMVPFMVDAGEEMIKVLNKKIDESGNGYVDIELKDLTTRYATDVIASCAFGLKVASQSSDSSFYLRTKDMTTFTLFRIIKLFITRSLPAIANMLKITMVSEETSSFFRNMVLSTMEDREKKNIIRHDMINILNEIKKGNLSHEKETDTDAGFATVEESTIGKKKHSKEWSDQDLVAQAVLFLFAGFDTVSTSMTSIIYELAINPEVQEKLYQEIIDHDLKNGGKFDYNSIQSMKYMDMVVSEGLRLYPPGSAVDRKCVKDYNLGRVNKTSTKDLIIRKGEIIGFPIWMFHRNSKLFPDPHKFDPERFSDENKHNIIPFSYLPFGAGPRNCIGSRFALCELKVMLYQLLRKMKVSTCERTTIPVQLAPGFIIKIKNGAWVRLQVR